MVVFDAGARLPSRVMTTVDPITDELLRCRYLIVRSAGRHLFVLGLGLVGALIIAEAMLAGITITYVAKHPIGWPILAGLVLGTGTSMAAVLAATAKPIDAVERVLRAHNANPAVPCSEYGGDAVREDPES
jgi:hypothetical protein